MAIQKELAHIRREIEAERVSYGELARLQELTPHIDRGDTLLCEGAGVPEGSTDAPDTNAA